MSTNKSLALTTYIFGYKYQEYLPPLIYSLKKAYPDYYPIIFLHEEINSSVLKHLEIIEKELGDFLIIENQYSDYKIKHIQKGESIRYILTHPEFYNFDCLYYVDTDMFYIKEPLSIVEQHNNHCDVLDLPYSNIIRKYSINSWAPGQLKKRLKQLPIFQALKLSIGKYITVKKLSGLHFVKTKEYFNVMTPIFEKYKEYIFSNKSFIHHPEGFNDESLLYDMIKESRIGLPPVLEDYGIHFLDPKRSDELGFRPHHGLHLGIFRSENSVNQYKEVLLQPFYKEYYFKYKQLYEEDDLLKQIIENSPLFIKNQFYLMNNFYSKNS
ncbi:MAG: hypothetical protein ACOCRX_05040 [Candidatus Woesearchaeota archaeon]